MSVPIHLRRYSKRMQSFIPTGMTLQMARNQRAAARYKQYRNYGLIAGPLINAGLKAYNYVKGGYTRKSVPVVKGEVVKPRRVRAQPAKNLKERVRNLEKCKANQESKYFYRSIDCIALKPAQNSASYYDFIINDNGTIEGMLTAIPYFNPASPGTLTNVNLLTPAFSQEICLRGYMSILIRNNYQVPVEVHVYKYHVKADTNIPLITGFTNGLADVGNPSSSSLVVFPGDSRQLNDLWKQDWTKSFVLKPGESRKCTISVPEIKYDPSLTDSQTYSYQRINKCSGFLVRASGVPSHDSTTTTQYGVSGAGVDILVKRYVTVTYDSGGVGIENIAVSDSLDTQTAAAMVSQPIMDNQSFSVS